jgi:hydrogenase expression/formation protein HypC
VCLAVAGRIVEIEGEGLERAGRLEVGTERRTVNLAMVPEAAKGDWVIFHAGYAMEVLAPEDAEELMHLHAEIAEAGDAA